MVIKAALRYGKWTNGDVWYADKFTGLSQKDMIDTAYISWTGDSTEVLGSSVSPITSMVFNLCPTKRYRPEGMLLLGMLPNKTPKSNMIVWYEAVLNRMKADGCFDGFEIYDAYLKRKRIYRIALHLFLEDLKGLPHVLCCSTTGTHAGVCPWCTVQGLYLAGADRYFTAILMLPINSPIREQFAVEFAALPGTYIHVFVLLLYCFCTAFVLYVFVLFSYRYFRSVSVLFPYCFRTSCFRTVFVLFSYCFRTLYFRTVLVLLPYYFRTIFVLFS